LPGSFAFWAKSFTILFMHAKNACFMYCFSL